MLLGRSYTGHEHLQSVGLINMNGRVYDSKLHRFLQPDNNVQDPFNTQNYNRYGYVLNNPLKYTDPSGEFWDLIFGALFSAYVHGASASGGELNPAKWNATGWKNAGLAVGSFGASTITTNLTNNYVDNYNKPPELGVSAKVEKSGFSNFFNANINGITQSEPVVEPISHTNSGEGKNNSRGENALDASQTTKLTSGYYTAPSFAMQGYSTQTFHEGSGYSESVYDFRTGVLESTNFKTPLGNYSLGTDGSFSYGNNFVSFGTIPNNVYTLDLSIPTGRNSSLGTTLYFSPQEFRNRMNHIINNIGQSLSKVWYVYPMTPQGIPYFTEF